MLIDFPYPGYDAIAPVEIRDRNLMGVYAPRIVHGVDEEAVLRRGFDEPYEAPLLRDAVRSNDRVLILIDDATRFTPIHRMMPYVVDELRAAGVKDGQIQVLTGQGTHREMSDDELRRKLGGFYGRLRIHQHHWKNEAEMHFFGHTRDGTPVKANRLLAESDFVLGLGSIVPHRVKGFSGGAKIAFPGVAGKEIMDRQQWEASMQMSETVMGVPENSMRLRMEEAAAMAGLKYIVNLVLDGAGHIVGCFAGDVVAAHRAGCKLSREITAVRLPKRADIVIVDSYPADRDIWQSAKGIYSGTMAVRTGGTMILVAPNPEGVAKNHPNLLEIGYKTHAEIVDLVQSGKVDDLIGVAILADIAQIIDQAQCILVSPGVKREDAEKIGFRYAASCAEALTMAFNEQGSRASVAVLRHGGHILPIADERAAAACMGAEASGMAGHGHEERRFQAAASGTSPMETQMNSANRQGARVSIGHTNEKHRSQDRVTELVREALAPLGGISAFVKPGNTVLLKPNQTVFYSAEEGCTTDPLVIGALIRLCKSAGASRVTVGESSGGFFDSLQCMGITGMTAVSKREGAEVINLGTVPTRIVRLPNAPTVKEAPIALPIFESDVVIDCPKAKNHHIEPISGALKNWMGSLNQQWRNAHHGHPADIGTFMEIMRVRPPDLVVVDAIIAGEGDGPIANLPRWCGCVLASTDPVATDCTICTLLGHDWRQLKYAEEAEKRGLGVRQPIEYLGVPLEDVAFDAWPGHKGFDYLPLNFLVGEGVTLDGTIGHVKSVLDSMLRRGDLDYVIWLKGTPTIMVGEIDDPHFEDHLREGPYVVFDDAAKPKYKRDPRVHFVPGHPVLRTAMPELFKGLGVSLEGKMFMKAQQYERRQLHDTTYGTLGRKAVAVARPLAMAALLLGGLMVAGALADRVVARREPDGVFERLRSMARSS